ncbi:hypothetical protein ACQUQP_02990 [Marinobacterium sp. YM272]|uniref:hypothetical protein n=1 Tax=Marinobacterium sp. YM272 TaxID=3421654 RepID=UPI003D7F31D3
MFRAIDVLEPDFIRQPLANIWQLIKPLYAMDKDRGLRALMPLAECDPAGCSTLLQPAPTHRFVSGKARTINTTAVGSNARLLELGSAER